MTETQPERLTHDQLRDELATLTRSLYVFTAPLPPDAERRAARVAVLDAEWRRRAHGGEYPGKWHASA